MHHDSSRSEVGNLLEGAVRAMASLRSCWLVTRDARGLPYARPMGHQPFDPAAFGWTLRFLVDRRTGKAREVEANPRVAVIFQRDEHAFVSIQGTARLLTSASDVASRWLPAYDVYFTREGRRENAAFIEVEASRMQLWIRGVTPEPFGLRTTELRREGTGPWELAR